MRTAEKTLLHLLKHPRKELHVRGIARDLGIAAQIISRNLKNLEKEALIKTKIIGKQRFASFEFNQKAKAFATYLLQKEKEEQKPELQPIINRIEEMNTKIIILFGSSLKNLTKANDIDALFIDDKLNVKKIDKQTTKLSIQTPKPIVPLLLETKDILIQYNNPAVQEALAGLVIRGFKEYIDLMSIIRT